MKYKFKAQTCILVAGMVASAYATCYMQETSGTAICFAAGQTVDYIYYWHGGTLSDDVVATSDWVHGYQTGTSQTKNFLNAYTTGSGYSTYTADKPLYCYGPAKFLGPGGNETVSYWENGAASNNKQVPDYPTGGAWGLPTGSSCP
jgi:hypothetical protein